MKKINGARQLAKSGYKESAVIVAKETYRKYPNTKKSVNDRIYFADILADLGLYQEAQSEFSDIKKIDMIKEDEQGVDQRIEEINMKLMSQ